MNKEDLIFLVHTCKQIHFIHSNILLQTKITVNNIDLLLISDGTSSRLGRFCLWVSCSTPTKNTYI